jgi:transcriptional regulator with XRE-family HTH domain
MSIDVGSKIRAYRKRKKISLMDLSRTTGIAASNLSSLELNKSSPTLSTLMKIASAFGVKVGAFLDETLYRKAVHCPAGEWDEIQAGSPAVSVRLVTSGILLNKMEAKVITLKKTAGCFDLEATGTDQFVYCIEGRISARVDDETFSLAKGDSLYLLPEASAAFELGTSKEATILLISAGAT